MNPTVLPGKHHRLGATYDGLGVNFALYSERATKVEVCLFEPGQKQPSRTIALPEVTGFVWHGYVPGLKPGQLYGFRVHGPFEPQQGLRFNPSKLVIDPYAKAITGKVDWSAAIFSYPLGHPEEDLAYNDEDDAWGMPKGVVVDSIFEWENDRPPLTPWHKTIIYEVHVRGFTMKHPDVDPHLRGTYAGLASKPAINYLKELGVTAVELLPIHDFLQEKHLLDRGLTNYWGYNTTNYFAPTSLYSSSGDMGEQVGEFKKMVKELHRAGIEVILDVVYNHTSEGNHLGPTLSFRGIDNPVYYRLVSDNARYYMDFTGTGNSLNVNHPQVLKLIMDSLRYWVTEMHVDGFRFDLASVLARELYSVDKLSSFFDIIHQDPILSQVKLIAEPWDLGDGGYQVGNFPVLWTEWNGRYRDSVRRYWKGDEGQTCELASRLLGSSDLYQNDGRQPHASINFVTAHDGFTLRDLVSYNEKHNEANGENNQDGTTDNLSWNHGAEGPTDDPAINHLRERQQRNFLTTLFLSQGVPMICGGDELGRTQNGNNNAYCQDNEISWYNWNLNEQQKDLLEFTKQLIKFRKEHRNFQRPKFFKHRKIHGPEAKDVLWFTPDGNEMTEENWNACWMRSFGVMLDGTKLEWIDREGKVAYDDIFLLLFNAHHESVSFRLPAGEWEVTFDTSMTQMPSEKRVMGSGECFDLVDRGMAVLCKLKDS